LKKNIKYSYAASIIVLLWFILWTSKASENKTLPILEAENIPNFGYSINDTIDSLKFPFKDYSNNPYDNQKESPMSLQRPSNITTEVEYDYETGKFVITNKIGNMRYGTPYVMDFDEYLKYEDDKSMRNYWKDKLANSSITDSTGNSFLDDYLKQSLNVGIKGLDKIFGSDEISITPTGAANLTFGLSYQRSKNLTLPINVQRSYTFDFQEDIKIGVTGKIGDKMNVGINWDTKATFNFENEVKLDYVGDEDEIIQKIQAGDVSMPLNNSLIPGSTTLFGLLTELKFGKLYVTSVLSQQKGESSVIEVDGGAVVSEFELSASDYEANKHFFVAHFFRDNYEKALKTLPVISSGYNITRLEVWITNETAAYEDSRNVVAFLDLGENGENIHATNLIYGSNQIYPNNESNNLYNLMTTTYVGIRDVSAVSSILNPLRNQGFVEGQDYVKLDNARKLKSSEFSFNEDLGYISLNSSIKDDAILAIACEYTVNGEVYKIGEFSNGDIASPNTLILKLLKGPAMTPALPNWDLMMKNVYSLGAYSVTSDDFKLEIMYNNDATGTKMLYIPDGAIKEKRLISVMNLDKTDNQLNSYPDGKFDFIEGITINSSNGRIYLPELEPFGDFLKQQINDDVLADKYIFTELYDSTQYKAQQMAEKNKFYIKGSYKSTSSSEIYLNAFNIPEGSVKVSAGAVQLVEGTDFMVDYSLGRVTILNAAYLTPGTPIKVNLESNSGFNIKTKSLIGTHLDYRFNENFNIGATVMKLTEKPYSAKIDIGDEPISNTIRGFNTAYSTNAPFLTRAVDFLPFIETKEASKISFSAEFAQLIPGNPRAIGQNGSAFIDDFEGSQSSLDMKSPYAWFLASTPQNQNGMFPEADSISFAYGYNRAKLAWYNVSQDLQIRNTVTPKYFTKSDLVDNHLTRLVLETEIFPNKQSQTGTVNRLALLNLAFYPKERGPYNFDLNPTTISDGLDDEGNLANPQSRWGGIMRPIMMSDFETANIEFIEFWIMDPFIYDTLNTNGGDLYFNLGDISEDILRDGKKSFENGLPYPPNSDLIDSSVWGVVSRKQMLTPTFDNAPEARKVQDVGFDGLDYESEKSFYNWYTTQIQLKYGTNSDIYRNVMADPSGDDFRFFLDPVYDDNKTSILDRYKIFNGIDGNSPLSTGNNIAYTSTTLYPDIEDVNMDNTMDVYENYFQYKVEIKPEKMVVGQNYITNIVEATFKNVAGVDETVKWYQFKVPISEPDEVIGNISDFKSIRFMRLFLNNFQDPIVLRFAKLELVRGDWRKYQNALVSGGEGTTSPQNESGSFDVSVVNIEESSTKSPVNYILPPGVTRESSYYGPTVTQLNEQALSLKVIDIIDGESKAVYKNIDMDIRKYKKLKMFIHAEQLVNEPLNDNDLTVFIRLGSDFKENYYEYEIPLKVTPAGFYVGNEKEGIDTKDETTVWPKENTLDLEFQILQFAKQKRNNAMSVPGSTVTFLTPYIYVEPETGRRITIMGNPNISNVKTLMIGIRNPNQENNLNQDDGLPKSAEVWVNELKLTDFNEDGGWAANARLSADLADFADFAIDAYTHTPGFGSIEKKVNERYKDQVMEYYISSNVQLGKFFPTNYGVSIPLYFGFSQSITNPQYNPLDPDILLQTTLKDPLLTDSRRDTIRNVSQDFVQRKNINLSNLKITGKPKAKTRFYDIGNWSSSVAYSEMFARDVNTEFNIDQNLTGSINYSFSNTPKNIAPFKKIKGLNKIEIIKDFNFYYMPSLFAFSAIMNRHYNTAKTRDVSTILNPELKGIDIPATYQKDFLWARTYDLTHKISKNLKLSFNAANSSRVDPIGMSEERGLFEKFGYQPADTIFHELYNLGQNTDYKQTLDIAWTTPINKLPLLKWTSLTANYGATYDWLRGASSVSIVDDATGDSTQVDFGNSIQNSQIIKLNGTLNFTKIYTSIKYLKNVNSRFTDSGRKPMATTFKEVSFTTKVKLIDSIPKIITHNLKTSTISSVVVSDSDGNPVAGDYEVINENKIKFTPAADVKEAKITVKGKKEQKENLFLIASDYTLFSLMSLQKMSLTYTQTKGILMYGFMPNTFLFGMEQFNNEWAPGTGFIFGEQDPDFLQKSYNKSWLVSDSSFNEPYLHTQKKVLAAKVTVEPINNFSIIFAFDRSVNFDETDYVKYGGDIFDIQNRAIVGDFAVSYNSIRTAFWKIGDTTSATPYYSKAFENFLSYRQNIAQRLGNQIATEVLDYDPTARLDTTGMYFPDGFNSNSQDVLILAFLAAYSGQSPDKIELTPFPKIPLPDWNITYDGLGNFPFIKEYVSKISITQNYSSTYSAYNFASNVNFNYNPQDATQIARYESNSIIPEYEIETVYIDESFKPFLGVDVTWNSTLSTKFEYAQSRKIGLSLSSNRIEELRQNGITIGLGYKFAQVPININVGGDSKHFKSDLILRTDISILNNKDIFRRIEENLSELSVYKKSFTLNSTADYTLSERFNIQLFYNHTFNEANIGFPITNIDVGFKIQFALTP